jgi:hypothetical protein
VKKRPALRSVLAACFISATTLDNHAFVPTSSALTRAKPSPNGKKVLHHCDFGHIVVATVAAETNAAAP